MPGARGARGPCARVVSTRQLPQILRTPGISCAMVLTAYSALPGDEFLLSPSSVDLSAVETRLGLAYLHKLDKQRVPGPHGFAVRSDHPHRLTRPCAAA
jgi:hypothetical protein